MQATGKERVICLTAERRSKRRGFKGSIHTCKPAGQGTYQARPLDIQNVSPCCDMTCLLIRMCQLDNDNECKDV